MFTHRKKTKAQLQQIEFNKANISTLIIDAFAVISLCAAFFFVYFGATTFGSGMHNVDLTYNYQRIAFKLDPITRKSGLALLGVEKATDTNSDFVERTLTASYINGLNYMYDGMRYMVVAAVLFVLGIFLFFYNRLTLLYDWCSEIVTKKW